MKTHAIDRYIARSRAYARASTRHAAQEAAYFAQTGDYQRLVAFFHLWDDATTTSHRLRRYQSYLAEARQAGRYDGGTTLRRLLPDGTTEPWEAPETAVSEPAARLVRRLWLRLGGQEE